MNIKEKSRSYEKSSGTFKYSNQANETKRQTAKFELNLPSKNRYSIQKKLQLQYKLCTYCAHNSDNNVEIYSLFFEIHLPQLRFH